MVTLTGTAPYFEGSLALATDDGHGANNGTLLVLPGETITATYTDSSPAGSSTAEAGIGCAGGNVIYLSSAQVSDNGDNDGIADNNETVTLDITIQNNTGAALTNTRVQIFSDTPATVDCVPDNQALYGTVAAGASQTNPGGDRFTFHVAPAVACADWQTPPTARFTVLISADGVNGSATLQTFNLTLDLDTTGAGGPYTLTQNFTVNPGWATAATPDDDGTCPGPYLNNFHWCAACGTAAAAMEPGSATAPSAPPARTTARRSIPRRCSRQHSWPTATSRWSSRWPIARRPAGTAPWCRRRWAPAPGRTLPSRHPRSPRSRTPAAARSSTA